MTWNNNLSPAKAAATCEYKDVKFFLLDSGNSNKGTFYYSKCHEPVTAEEYLDREEEELRWMNQLGGNDISVPEDSVNREITGNGSRNIPNIGKNVPDTMCDLGDIRNIFQHIPDTEYIISGIIMCS